jgi:hypothetical protein
MADQLIQSQIKCDLCSMEIEKADFEKHKHSCHQDIDHEHVSYTQIFDWVPGAGHMEKNFLHTIFKMCRYIFLESLADSLGFRSKRAKDFVVGCSNHHVSWQVARIILEAFARELLYEYIVYCTNNQIESEVCASHFVKWRNEQLSMFATPIITLCMILFLTFSLV